MSEVKVTSLIDSDSNIDHDMKFQHIEAQNVKRGELGLKIYNIVTSKMENKKYADLPESDRYQQNVEAVKKRLSDYYGFPLDIVDQEDILTGVVIYVSIKECMSVMEFKTSDANLSICGEKLAKLNDKFIAWMDSFKVCLHRAWVIRGISPGETVRLDRRFVVNDFRVDTYFDNSVVTLTREPDVYDELYRLVHRSASDDITSTTIGTFDEVLSHFSSIVPRKAKLIKRVQCFLDENGDVDDYPTNTFDPINKKVLFNNILWSVEFVTDKFSILTATL